MNLSKLILVSFILFIVASCASTVTKTPSHSRAEIEAEKKTQQLLVAQEKIREKRNQERRVIEMRQRLSHVAAPISEVAAHLCLRFNHSNADLCVYDFELNEQSNEINAAADGKKIYVNAAMMRFAESDEELAIVLGHEVAHNMMGHIDKMKSNMTTGAVFGALLDVLVQSNGVTTDGAFSKTGAGIAANRHSVKFEEEADYVGLYITYNAGYDISNAPNFWRKMSLKYPKAIFTSTTHPSNASRFLALQKTVDEILAKDARGEELIPEIKS